MMAQGRIATNTLSRYQRDGPTFRVKVHRIQVYHDKANSFPAHTESMTGGAYSSRYSNATILNGWLAFVTALMTANGLERKEPINDITAHSANEL